ncbi:MAG: flagellar basal body P-ring protein FlgI [Massilia sp.]
MFKLVLVALLSTVGPVSNANTDVARVKDLGKVQGWRENALVGYGIVTGLAGTGDSSTNKVTRQALANVYSQFNLTIPSDQVQSRNAAIVMVSANLSPFARAGDTLDVTVTSAGDARSLVGGSLLLTPLKGADGEVHALAQGALTVGGYRYDANGNIVQKNHPTLGSIPGGAIVELGVETHVLQPDRNVTFVLSEPDYTTASRVAHAINAHFRVELAQPRDASGIDIRVPDATRGKLVDFMAQLENVLVEPDQRAKVVINERTGTLVAGGDVRIAKVAISHGDLKVSVASETTASQPMLIGRAVDGVQTALVTNTRVDVDEPRGTGYVAPANTVADLVQALARLKISTRDMISILRAVKAAGALHAELIVQ